MSLVKELDKHETSKEVVIKDIPEDSDEEVVIKDIPEDSDEDVYQLKMILMTMNF
jgi:ssDNA-specific exonuclease RecJ